LSRGKDEYSEKLALLIDCLTMCKNNGLCMAASRFLVSGMGLRFALDRINRFLQEQINTDRRINIKFGMDHCLNTLQQRFIREPFKESPTRGSVIDIG